MSQSIITVKNYGFTYPDQERPALEDINMELKQGAFVVLCGSSGCGKSTLLRQLKPVLRPHGQIQGEVYFGGRKLSDLDEWTQSAAIGYVMQDPDAQLVTDKVWHELAFGLESLGYDQNTIRLRVAEMASYFGIQSWFYKNVDELSGGQKQLLNLASVMAMHPNLLILDEPTSQLDPIAADGFFETIEKINRELGITILMTEHRLEEVLPKADQVIFMDHGRIRCMGTPGEVAKWLHEQNHSMFRAMPAPAQIYLADIGRWGQETEGVPEAEKIPLTVREGRIWLNEKLGYQWRLSTEEAEKTSERIQGKPLLTMKDIWFRYEQNSPDVLRGTSISLYGGEIYGLLGGNGTGKTTLLSVMARVRKPYRGKILLNGKDIRSYSDYQLYREYLGVMPQNPQSLFVKKTVELELYEMIGGPKERMGKEFPVDMKKSYVVEEIAELTHLSHLMDHHPYDLSGGEQQRLALAKILLLRPKILLMDEPTKGMDAGYKEEFADILKKLAAYGISIFLISHDIEFCARYADRCGMFFDGSVVTEHETKQFFAGNSFYTTSTNRMVRHMWPQVILPGQVSEQIREAGGDSHA